MYLNCFLPKVSNFLKILKILKRQAFFFIFELFFIISFVRSRGVVGVVGEK